MDNVLQKLMPLGVGNQTALRNYEQAARELHQVPFPQAYHRLARFSGPARVDEVLSRSRISAAQFQYHRKLGQRSSSVGKELFSHMSSSNIVSKHHLFP